MNLLKYLFGKPSTAGIITSPEAFGYHHSSDAEEEVYLNSLKQCRALGSVVVGDDVINTGVAERLVDLGMDPDTALDAVINEAANKAETATHSSR